MRPSVLFAAGAIALALAALLVFQRDGPAPPPRTTVAPAAIAPQPAPPALPDKKTAPPADVVALAAPPDEPDFPPPTPDQIMPRPERRELAPAEISAQKLASLDLIARGIERLEQERQAAANTGDDETARLNKIRIERLQLRREELEQALETAQDAP